MNSRSKIEIKYPSTTHYILASLIPYTEANLKLTFKPSAFIYDLDRLEKVKATKASLRSAYYRALKQNLIEIDKSGVPRLTANGIRKIKPYKPKKLKNAQLMIIFDIPEIERWKRRHLRILLKELSFKQVQKSVWISENDHREYLKFEIRENKLEKYVEIFEARSL